MSANQKDKRTKEQILKLLDNAIEQEERLSEKIKSLETELADCRKKAEDPRAELTEEALSSSKVSFRLDYYRTAKHGPLKGIIEHLPSRETKAFEGDGQEIMGQFVARFLSEETGVGKKKKSNAVKEITAEPVVEARVENPETGLETIKEESAKEQEEMKQQTEMVAISSELDVEQEINDSPEAEITVAEFEEVVITQSEFEADFVAEEQHIANFKGSATREKQAQVVQVDEQQTSRLLQRLRTEAANEISISDVVSVDQAELTTEQSTARSERVRRLLEKIAPQEANIRPVHRAEVVESATKETDRPSLLDRLREEYHSNRLPN